jgi:hypothetical protein
MFAANDWKPFQSCYIHSSVGRSFVLRTWVDVHRWNNYTVVKIMPKCGKTDCRNSWPLLIFYRVRRVRVLLWLKTHWFVEFHFFYSSILYFISGHRYTLTLIIKGMPMPYLYAIYAIYAICNLRYIQNRQNYKSHTFLITCGK